MAEVRKHRPRTSSIGDQVRANIDSGPRPVAPGAPPTPDFDPFFTEEPSEDVEASHTTSSAAAVSGTGGWFTFGVATDEPDATSDGPSAAS
ncbi:MAG: hypothetical protein WBL05_12140 [Brooklawnia sp.]|uniref:hypothetical protein n=1 Tax=Brooklawnia sp. TaxID=2699740 RepID=UPI003C712683